MTRTTTNRSRALGAQALLRRGGAALTIAAAVGMLAAACGEGTAPAVADAPGTVVEPTSDAGGTQLVHPDDPYPGPSVEEAVLAPESMPPLWASEEHPWRVLDVPFTDEDRLFACQPQPLSELGAEESAGRYFGLGPDEGTDGASAVLEFADEAGALAALETLRGWVSAPCAADELSEAAEAQDLGPLVRGEQPALNVQLVGTLADGDEGLFEWVGAAVTGDRLVIVTSSLAGQDATWDPAAYPAGPVADVVEAALIHASGAAG